MVEEFLAKSGLRLDYVDYYAAVVDRDSFEILAGGGFENDIIKCIAVSETLRGTGVSQQLISHLISEMNSHGVINIKVFTKPSNADIFHSLGFKTIGNSNQALLLENSLEGILSYTHYLKSLKKDGKNGLIVMNANPFTLGHQYLVEQAAMQVDNLYVIVVNEDKSAFTSSERYSMVEKGCSHIDNVTVCNGSSYIISAATFPSYFIKKMDDVSRAQIELDLDITARHIAPALGVNIRFVGSEPVDELTRGYNNSMQQILPQRGINVLEIPRIVKNEQPICASDVRELIKDGYLREASKLVPSTSLPYLIAWTACHSLKQELDLTPKPGLVDTADNGAHSDMDYNTMFSSINSLRHYFVQLAILGCDHDINPSRLQQLGVDAENAMLKVTAGVNTHRGALFSMGLAVIAVAKALTTEDDEDFLNIWKETVMSISKQLPGGNDTHGAGIKHSNNNIVGALDMARDGYSQLIEQWLPFYCNNIDDEFVKQKTLLLIMSELDDTNVIHRAGFEMAQQVKQDAAHLLENFSIEGLEQMNRRFIDTNISPGGAADMLSLTIFLSALIKKDNN